MTEAERSAEPVSLRAATAALEAIDQSVKNAHRPSARTADAPEPSTPEPGQSALAALLTLREVREQLAGWESGLIEIARGQGASWADLAGPLGVASRQAAERRYLRLRPGKKGSTGEERVQSVRDQRAADRTVAAWAETNAGRLRQLAGQILGLGDLPAGSGGRIDELTAALGQPDTARLAEALTATHPDLREHHRELATRVDDLRKETHRLRSDSDEKRKN
ncbi:HSP18 transcriptional regulator [Streptomyces sp. NPDC048507]|uniref:HSP18 transcriptional regulator n=1 Tax=Streptomyces sp. NPDC048507 TaxID=3365560 RepID=UPI0037150CA6